MVEKSEKTSKNLPFFSKNCKFLKYIFLAKRKEKKSVSFLNFRTTQFDQSSPVQPNPEKKNLKKSEKISLKKNLKKIKVAEKKAKRKKSLCLISDDMLIHIGFFCIYFTIFTLQCPALSRAKLDCSEMPELCSPSKFSILSHDSVHTASKFSSQDSDSEKNYYHRRFSPTRSYTI